MVKAWKERVTIPTYEVGEPEKNPVFLEKRVYQGSSGRVYPYQVIESISDSKTDKEYEAVFIENEYIRVMVLPELGGRIQMAYDKIRKRHFVYYNHVIKPALVGLAGPWISGGIEFNWPQHHRPSTFMPVDCNIRENEDGSVSVLVNEIERMFHQKGMAAFTLRPGCAYLEIEGTLYNPTPLPQTFLWWANPAVAVNDHYRSVFPPDINAVFDHGKRAVSSFPIATGTYYKMDYSSGVDIANYKNIFVPTSYMGVNSKYDFEGGYECDTEAGMLHVASNHFSPGKKQWTWGNGEFGRAWDRNLTDEDGPYIELMAGVFTENQPDFSWLMPYEEKHFKQYFMPYREIGMVKNASKDLIFNIEPSSDGNLLLKVLATSTQKVDIIVKASDGREWKSEVELSPEQVLTAEVPFSNVNFEDIEVIFHGKGRTIPSWKPEPDEIRELPAAAEAPLLPEDTKTVEELYLTGLHLEQYRHATYDPTEYYEEGLRRDPGDVRCNNAMGLFCLRQGRFEDAEKYFKKAIKRLIRRNPNPYDGEPLYNLGVACWYLGKYDEAYSLFYKSTWNASWQDAGFLWCARISASLGNTEDALYELDRCLARNSHNHQARALKILMLHKVGNDEAALKFAEESLELDPFNFATLFAKYLISGSNEILREFKNLMRREPHNYDEVGIDLTLAGQYEVAERIWECAEEEGAVSPMTYYYWGWSQSLAGKDEKAKAIFAKGSNSDPSGCFPNRIDAVNALTTAMEVNSKDAVAPYLLGNLCYDKRRYERAIELWEISRSLNPSFPTVWRNLALAYFNKCGDSIKALEFMEKAFSLNHSDARVLMELDQLRKRLHVSDRDRINALKENINEVDRRDDLYLEFATLLNSMGEYARASEMISRRNFHPWEGGEGKVSAQYQYSRLGQAAEAFAKGDFHKVISLMKECREYPENLGEGKLYGAQENDFYYIEGIAHLALGEKEKGEDCLRLATVGPEDPAPALYYNDARPHKIFYAGLSYRALGEENKARSCFNKLIQYGKQHYHDKVRMDYFAVSLPDLLIWDDSLDTRNRVHCLFMLALGSIGLGEFKKGEKYLAEAIALDPSHTDMKTVSILLATPNRSIINPVISK